MVTSWHSGGSRKLRTHIPRKQEVKNASGARLIYILKVPQPVQTAWGPKVPVQEPLKDSFHSNRHESPVPQFNLLQCYIRCKTCINVWLLTGLLILPGERATMWHPKSASVYSRKGTTPRCPGLIGGRGWEWRTLEVCSHAEISREYLIPSLCLTVNSPQQRKNWEDRPGLLRADSLVCGTLVLVAPLSDIHHMCPLSMVRASVMTSHANHPLLTCLCIHVEPFHGFKEVFLGQTFLEMLVTWGSFRFQTISFSRILFPNSTWKPSYLPFKDIFLYTILLRVFLTYFFSKSLKIFLFLFLITCNVWVCICE